MLRLKVVVCFLTPDIAEGHIGSWWQTLYLLLHLLLLYKQGCLFKERVPYSMAALPFNEIIEVRNFTRSIAVLWTSESTNAAAVVHTVQLVHQHHFLLFCNASLLLRVLLMNEITGSTSIQPLNAIALLRQMRGSLGTLRAFLVECWPFVVRILKESLLRLYSLEKFLRSLLVRRFSTSFDSLWKEFLFLILDGLILAVTFWNLVVLVQSL